MKAIFRRTGEPVGDRQEQVAGEAGSRPTRPTLMLTQESPGLRQPLGTKKSYPCVHLYVRPGTLAQACLHREGGKKDLSL